MPRNQNHSFIQELILITAAPILAYFLARQIFSRLDPDAGAKAEAKSKALAASSRLQSLLTSHEQDDTDDDREYDDEDDEEWEERVKKRKEQEKRDRKRQENITLTSYEQTIAMEVVLPSEIPVTFNDIGGLDDIIEELRESVIYPLTMPQLYSQHSSLLTAPSGVLLYGPPGCGKTMLAKALARESGACFINLHISTLTEKWYGDSNKLTAAVFSLARKFQPAIVFIDEIDAVLGQRRSGEHEASGMVKAEFMTHWDGLSSTTTEDGTQRICILGATNRMQDIDEAILRRMPKKFPVNLPNKRQRRSIFNLTLRDTKIDTSNFDMDVLVQVSVGMSGSDIKEACRDAAMVPIREYMKTARSNGRHIRSVKPNAVRGLQTQDFFGRRGGAMNPVEPGDHPPTRGKAEDSGSEHSGSTEEVEDFADADVIEAR